MSLKHALLGVLEARPMSGYELGQFFESSTNWVWAAPKSQIYPLLRDLEQQGLVRSEESVRGERLRRVSYSITDSGIVALREWLAEDQEMPVLRDAVLLQCVFLDMIEPERADAVLRHHIDRLTTDIARWEVHRAGLLARTTPLLVERLKRRAESEHERVAALKAHVFDFLIDDARLRIKWAERGLALIAGTENPPVDGP